MARSKSRTTWAAIALSVAITVPYVVIFVQTLRAIVHPDSVSEEMLLELAMMGALSQGDQAWIAFSYLAATLGAVNLVVLVVIGGLIARRQAAREAAFAVFGVITLVAGLAALGGLVGGHPSGGSWLGAITGLACLGVVVLLALESTGTDFELAEMERRRRRPSR
jgi:alkylhydroperoxidase/carboxymuconolactone decarboxylase family protein YurZ